MKYIIALLLFIPVITSGQVKLDDLKTKNGVAFVHGDTKPFTGKAVSYFQGTNDVQTSMEYIDGEMKGEMKSWYKKDKLQVEGFVDKGQKTGTWKLYFESGNINKQPTFKNNAENGEETFWFENGNIAKKGNYTDGKLNGKYTWYYETGQKKQEGYFVNGREDSTWSDWYENGKQKMLGHFTNFERNGEWTWWDEKGNITSSKFYTDGLAKVEKENADTYLEKMEFYLNKKDFKQSVKYIELAVGTQTDKTENNPLFMSLSVYHSKCYSVFFHNRQSEKILLDAIGLTSKQSLTIQNSHIEKSPGKINQLIKDISEKDKSKFQISNHIALALCYNILGDTISLQNEQQLMMEKGDMKDYIIQVSLALYKLLAERNENYYILEEIDKEITRKGISEKLELEKAHYLLRTEKFEEARMIADKYLKMNDKNLTALLLITDIEMALGNIEKMKNYETRVLAIDPTVFSNTKE